MNKILVWSVIAAMAGFLFGFDTVVISGTDKQLQALWHSSDAFHGSVVMGMALWGTVVGAIFGSIPANSLGRKKTLFWIGVLYLVSALGSALANDPFIFAAFRFLGGLGVGASTIAAPAYVSEIAPAEKRGRLVALYQFNIVLGILTAFVSNYFLKDTGENAWRWMLGIQAVPALLYTLLITTIPLSPRWLVSKKRYDEARAVLAKVAPHTGIDALLQEINLDTTTQHETLFSKKYRFPVLLAFLMAFFNQASGINAFLYYAPRIFEEAGLGQSTALLSSIGIGIINLIFTFIGVVLIDKYGRRLLMYIGSVGYIISLGLVSAAFYFGWGGITVPLFLFIFIAAHAIGQGAVIWVFISEIFPNHVRASGQAFGSSVHWVLAAIIPSLIPTLFSTVGPAVVFMVFTVMMVFQLLFVMLMMPETKGVSLEVLSSRLTEKHT